MRRHKRTGSESTTRATAIGRAIAYAHPLGSALLAGLLIFAAPTARSESAVAQAGNAEGGGAPGVSSAAPAAGVRADLDAQLAAGLAAEEGDADPERALALYESVVQRYDAVREAAAKALLRMAEIKRTRGDATGSEAAFRRVAEKMECSDETKRAALSALPQAPPGPGASIAVMSPDLMRRYGLLPAAASGASGGYGGGAPAGAAGAAGASTTESRAVFSMSPELRKRYGLDAAPAATGTAARSTAAQASPEETVQAARVSDARNNLEMLRAEALKVNAELRAVKREMRATQGVRLEMVPLSMVTDSMLLRMLNDLDGVTLAVSKAGEADRESRRAEFERSRSAAANYFAETYRMKLEIRHNVLERERSQLAQEVEEATKELLNLK